MPFEAWYDRGQSWKTAQILIVSLSSKVCLPTNHTPLLTTRLYVLVCYMVLVHFVDFPCKNLCHIAKNLQKNGGSSQEPVRTQKGTVKRFAATTRAQTSVLYTEAQEHFSPKCINISPISRCCPDRPILGAPNLLNAGYQPERGASLASIATSSPMEVRTITSTDVSRLSRGVRGGERTGIFLLLFEEASNLFPNFALRDLDIIFGVAVIAHKRQKTIIRNVKL